MLGPFADEEIQSTCLRWIAEFLLFVQPTMVPFVPRLIPVILGSLAHHVSSIRTAANETNFNLYNVIQSLPSPTPAIFPLPSSTSINAAGKQPELPPRDRTLTASPTPASIPFPTLVQPSATISRITSTDRLGPAPLTKSDASPTFSAQFESLDVGGDGHSKASSLDALGAMGERDPFDYGATVNALTLQFLNEHEETRVAALEWLLMLHTKAPKKVRRQVEGD